MRRLSKLVQKNKAEQGLRFANYLIDRIIIIAIIFFIHFILGLIYELTHLQLLRDYFSYLEKINRLEDYFFSGISYALYCFIMEKLTNGRTIGKYITKTQAISMDGKKMTTKQLLYRTLSRIVPFEAFSFLGKLGWHDSWSETRVVNLNTYQYELQKKHSISHIGKE